VKYFNFTISRFRRVGNHAHSQANTLLSVLLRGIAQKLPRKGFSVAAGERICYDDCMQYAVYFPLLGIFCALSVGLLAMNGGLSRISSDAAMVPEEAKFSMPRSIHTIAVNDPCLLAISQLRGSVR